MSCVSAPRLPTSVGYRPRQRCPRLPEQYGGGPIGHATPVESTNPHGSIARLRQRTLERLPTARAGHHHRHLCEVRTTWMQQIVSMLVFRSAETRPIWDLSLWPEMRTRGPIEGVLAAAEAQTHRRFFKTQLPLDALPIYEDVKVTQVARDGRDAAMSLHDHVFNFTADNKRRRNEISRSDPK